MTDARRPAVASGVASAVGTPTLFDGTLIAGGAPTVPLAWLPWTTAADRLGRVRAAGFAVTGVALAAVGVAHAAGWLAWSRRLLSPGLAGPEFVGAVALAAWVTLPSPVAPPARRRTPSGS